MGIENKELIIRTSNKYIRFVESTLPIIQKSRIPLYSCKYSKKVYTQHQLLKEYLQEDYRDIVEIVDLMTPVRELLKLETVPHFTTLHKCMTRIRSLLFNILLSRILHLFYFRGEMIHLLRSTRADSPVRMQAPTTPGGDENNFIGLLNFF